MAKSFVVACREYFGPHAGQSLMDFKKEVDALTFDDKAELAPLLSAALGEEVAGPTVGK